MIAQVPPYHQDISRRYGSLYDHRKWREDGFSLWLASVSRAKARRRHDLRFSRYEAACRRKRAQKAYDMKILTPD